MKPMFFDYRLVQHRDNEFAVSSASEVQNETGKDLFAKSYLQTFVSTLPNEGNALPFRLHLGFPEEIVSRVGEIFSDNEEAYAVLAGEDGIDLYGAGERGLNYAVSTVRLLFADGKFETVFLYDYPDKPLRGYRVFTPGEKNFTDFYNVVDYLLLYKFNTIIIEVGGAMEYERHPEINKKWVEFCEEMHRSPYETDRVEHKTYPWTKNAIHADNGGGSFITKKQMKELVDYCKARGFEVIPEVPSLSHCDYLVQSHPEINERVEDAYPDHYCPSDPRSYELLFDVHDEIIEVFNPKYMNIGHDEAYTMCCCPKCKGKDPVDLYIGDIEKINDRLNEKGIRAMMWCEKTYEVRLPNGWPIGGVGNMMVDIPRLLGCVGRIPKNVILLDWYWSHATPEMEQKNIDCGNDLLYGNVNAVHIAEYRRRPKEIKGGFVSNWGSFEPEYMQRNEQNIALLSTAFVFWSATYDSNDKPEVFRKVSDVLFDDYKRSLGKNRISLTHSTDCALSTRHFYDGYYITDEEWLLGNYEVCYTDGTKALLPVKYGYNIRNKELTLAPSYEYGSTVGACLPVRDGDSTVYKTAFTDPHPEKEIASITYRPIKEYQVDLLSWKRA